MIWGTLWELFCIKKLEKQRFGTTRSGHEKSVQKRYDFWEAGISKSEPPCRREHDFEVLSNSRKKLHIGDVLVPPFGAFGVSYRRKHGFQGCLNFVRFLDRLLHHFKHPKWSPKSYLSSMGTGSAINYESLANICKKFPQTLTEFTYISISLIII